MVWDLTSIILTVLSILAGIITGIYEIRRGVRDLIMFLAAILMSLISYFVANFGHGADIAINIAVITMIAVCISDAITLFFYLSWVLFTPAIKKLYDRFSA